MKTALLRTGSVPVHPSFMTGSPRVSASIHESVSGGRSNFPSPRFPLHLEVNRRGIRRVLSTSAMTGMDHEVSDGVSKLSGVGALSFPSRIPAEEFVFGRDEVDFTERRSGGKNYAGSPPETGILAELYSFPDCGIGNGRTSGRGSCGDDNFGTGGFTGGSADRSKIGAYYQEMLKSNPTNSLLLRNYGKYLHEVEGDAVKAEEYYGRAILAGPGDGEVLSLYGKLIWETERDESRAKSYFDQAVQSSPDDCMVLGSYAQFMWEAEEDEEDEERKRSIASGHG